MGNAWPRGIMFELEEHGTTVRTELLAGLTTYVTMVYIAFVNPAILAEAGMDKGAVFVATCLAAAFGSAFMGLYANYPVALAPGMGLNAYFTFSVVKDLGVPWQTALGIVFLSGVLFLLVSVTPVRVWIINSISNSLKLAIAVGIGFFLVIIGLRSAGVIVADPTTLVTLGDLKSPGIVIAVLAFILMAALHARSVHGAILISILAAYAASLGWALSTFTGIASLPPSIAPVLLQMDVARALDVGLAAIVFTFLFVVALRQYRHAHRRCARRRHHAPRRHAAAPRPRACCRIRPQRWWARHSGRRPPRATSKAPPA